MSILPLSQRFFNLPFAPEPRWSRRSSPLRDQLNVLNAPLSSGRSWYPPTACCGLSCRAFGETGALRSPSSYPGTVIMRHVQNSWIALPGRRATAGGTEASYGLRSETRATATTRTTGVIRGTAGAEGTSIARVKLASRHHRRAIGAEGRRRSV